MLQSVDAILDAFPRWRSANGVEIFGSELDAYRMLIIRREQLRTLEDATLAPWLVEHLEHFFPDRCSVLGQTELSETVRIGIERARRYGFVDTSDICQYVNLMLTFHHDFDRDGTLKWAAEILGDPDITDPGMRMELLLESAQDHLGIEE